MRRASKGRPQSFAITGMSPLTSTFIYGGVTVEACSHLGDVIGCVSHSRLHRDIKDLCLSSFYGRWPHSPVRRPYLDPFVGFGCVPLDPPTTRRQANVTEQLRPSLSMTATSRSAVYGAVGYCSPIHTKSICRSLISRFDLDHSPKKTPSAAHQRKMEARRIAVNLAKLPELLLR